MDSTDGRVHCFAVELSDGNKKESRWRGKGGRRENKEVVVLEKERWRGKEGNADNERKV